jgi:hypothetical protein
MAEFSAAMSVAQQRSLIQVGKSYLEDLFRVGITTFVPPWNLCNEATLQAMKEEGFKSLSAAPPQALSSTCSTEAIRRAGLSYVPATLDASYAPSLIRLAKRFDRKGAFVSFVFHDYDFVESPYRTTQASVTDTLRAIKRAVSGEECETLLARELQNGIGDDYERCSANLALQKTIWETPIRRRFAGRVANVYWSTASARQLRRVVQCVP